MPRPPKLIARDARILSAYSAGATIPQIAGELGCTASQIFGALKQAGVTRRRREEYARLARGWRT